MERLSDTGDAARFREFCFGTVVQGMKPLLENLVFHGLNINRFDRL
jgi:hypothetical protein